MNKALQDEEFPVCDVITSLCDSSHLPSVCYSCSSSIRYRWPPVRKLAQLGLICGRTFFFVAWFQTAFQGDRSPYRLLAR